MLVSIKQPILAEMASYRGENDVEYLLIQLEIGRGKIHEVWLVNDEVVDVKRDINKWKLTQKITVRKWRNTLLMGDIERY